MEYNSILLGFKSNVETRTKHSFFTTGGYRSFLQGFKEKKFSQPKHNLTLEPSTDIQSHVEKFVPHVPQGRSKRKRRRRKKTKKNRKRRKKKSGRLRSQKRKRKSNKTICKNIIILGRYFSQQ